MGVGSRSRAFRVSAALLALLLACAPTILDAVITSTHLQPCSATLAGPLSTHPALYGAVGRQTDGTALTVLRPRGGCQAEAGDEVVGGDKSAGVGSAGVGSEENPTNTVEHVADGADEGESLPKAAKAARGSSTASRARGRSASRGRGKPRGRSRDLFADAASEAGLMPPSMAADDPAATLATPDVEDDVAVPAHDSAESGDDRPPPPPADELSAAPDYARESFEGDAKGGDYDDAHRHVSDEGRWGSASTARRPFGDASPDDGRRYDSRGEADDEIKQRAEGQREHLDPPDPYRAGDQDGDVKYSDDGGYGGGIVRPDDHELKRGRRRDERAWDDGHDGYRVNARGRRPNDGGRAEDADREYYDRELARDAEYPRRSSYSPGMREAPRSEWGARGAEWTRRRGVPEYGREASRDVPAYGRGASRDMSEYDRPAGPPDYGREDEWAGGGRAPRVEHGGLAQDDYDRPDRGGGWNDARRIPPPLDRSPHLYRRDDDYYSSRPDRGDRRRGGSQGERGASWTADREPPYRGYSDRGPEPPLRAYPLDRAPSLPRGDPRYPDPRRGDRVSLLVRNLSKFTRRGMLRRIFGRFGPVTDVYIPRDYHSGKLKSFSFIEFLDYEGAKAAVGEMDGQSVDGRVLSVCFAQLARKSGSEMEDRNLPRPSSLGKRPPPPREPRFPRERFAFEGGASDRSYTRDDGDGAAYPAREGSDRCSYGSRPRQHKGGWSPDGQSARQGRQAGRYSHSYGGDDDSLGDERAVRQDGFADGADADGADLGGRQASSDRGSLMERGEGLQDGGERSRKEGVGGDEFRGASPKGAGDARAPKEGLSAEEQLTHDYDAAVSAGLVPPMDPKVTDAARE